MDKTLMLNELIKHYSNGSESDFANKIGVTPQTITNWKNRNTFNIDKIYTNCENVSADWLISCKGDMLKPNKSIQTINRNRKTIDKLIENQEIPLYDFEAMAGLKELFSSGSAQIVLDTIKIPNLPKCDGAVAVTGDSMYPLLKSGDLILYKQIPTDYTNLFFGEMYLIGVRIDEWEEYITVKYIHKSEKGSEYVTLVSQNQHHQSKDIKFSQITALAMVKASIRYNTMF